MVLVIVAHNNPGPHDSADRGSEAPRSPHYDIAVIGAGAAGLATAIFAAARASGVRVVLFDGARQPGAKILISGGSRCNVTNAVVTERDFNGGRPAIVRRVLAAFPASKAADYFRQLGVALHEEPGGKLFPDSNRSRDVLEALLRESARRGVELRAGHRVLDVANDTGMFRLTTSQGTFRARCVVLATGGLSLPKTGSDGWGYEIAKRFGHSLVPMTPALAPLVLNGQPPTAHRELSGVSHDVRIDIRVDGAVRSRIRGALLWTHFGISGPAALDASRHWLRAKLERSNVQTTLSLAPDHRFESLDATFIELAKSRPRLSVHNAVAAHVPAAVASVLLGVADIPGPRRMAEITREERRTVTRALVEWPLPIADSRGYNYAEVTAGGVTLTEINPATMESRLHPGLYLVGEILDVDGRIGGFNFQWAWSSAYVAGAALGAQRT